MEYYGLDDSRKQRMTLNIFFIAHKYSNSRPIFRLHNLNLHFFASEILDSNQATFLHNCCKKTILEVFLLLVGFLLSMIFSRTRV